MLRQWSGDSNKLILDMLKQFGVEASDIFLHKYEALTPDSFIWKITHRHNDEYTNYYLYAEDYVPSLEHVVKEIEANLASWSPNDKVKLMPVTKRIKWEHSDPVKSTDTYQKPERASEFMKFAATSGFDYVFLAKITNEPKTNLD